MSHERNSAPLRGAAEESNLRATLLQTIRKPRHRFPRPISACGLIVFNGAHVGMKACVNLNQASISNLEQRRLARTEEPGILLVKDKLGIV
jgi:hypothetical protein